MNTIIIYICLIVSLCLFVWSPNRYNETFCNGCFCVFIIAMICYFKKKNKKNYFDFDTIFILTSIFMLYLYPIVVYPATQSTEILLFDFDVAKISKGTALSTLGLCSYLAGSISYKKKKSKKKLKSLLKVKKLTAFSIVCFVIYIALGGWLKMRMAYQNEHNVDSGPSEYFYLLAYISLSVCIAIWFNNEYIRYPLKFNYKYLSKPFILYLGIFVIMMLLAGGRTVPMQLVLCSIGLYAYLYKPIPFWLVSCFMVLGIVGMFGILLLRSQSEIIETSGEDNYVMFTDLLVVARNSFECISYVEKHGFTYGVSLLSPLLAAIPLLQGIMLPLFEISPSEASSAKLLTAFSLGENSKTGVGTNIIADLYISFGIIGVIVGMLLLGRFIATLYNNGKKSIYQLGAYGVMISYAVYLVRAEYFFFVRALIWTYCIIYFVKHQKDTSI